MEEPGIKRAKNTLQKDKLLFAAREKENLHFYGKRNCGGKLENEVF